MGDIAKGMNEQQLQNNIDDLAQVDIDIDTIAHEIEDANQRNDDDDFDGLVVAEEERAQQAKGQEIIDASKPSLADKMDRSRHDTSRLSK